MSNEGEKKEKKDWYVGAKPQPAPRLHERERKGEGKEKKGE